MKSTTMPISTSTPIDHEDKKSRYYKMISTVKPSLS